MIFLLQNQSKAESGCFEAVFQIHTSRSAKSQLRISFLGLQIMLAPMRYVQQYHLAICLVLILKRIIRFSGPAGYERPPLHGPRGPGPGPRMMPPRPMYGHNGEGFRPVPPRPRPGMGMPPPGMGMGAPRPMRPRPRPRPPPPPPPQEVRLPFARVKGSRDKRIDWDARAWMFGVRFLRKRPRLHAAESACRHIHVLLLRTVQYGYEYGGDGYGPSWGEDVPAPSLPSLPSGHTVHINPRVAHKLGLAVAPATTSDQPGPDQKVHCRTVSNAAVH
jgi:hypothetical protein